MSYRSRDMFIIDDTLYIGQLGNKNALLECNIKNMCSNITTISIRTNHLLDEKIFDLLISLVDIHHFTKILRFSDISNKNIKRLIDIIKLFTQVTDLTLHLDSSVSCELSVLNELFSNCDNINKLSVSLDSHLTPPVIGMINDSKSIKSLSLNITFNNDIYSLDFVINLVKTLASNTTISELKIDIKYVNNDFSPKLIQKNCEEILLENYTLLDIQIVMHTGFSSDYKYYINLDVITDRNLRLLKQSRFFHTKAAIHTP